MHQDLTTLRSFLQHHANRLKREENKVVKCRSFEEPFQDFYTLLNPSLRQTKSGDFVPLVHANVVGIREFYCTHWFRNGPSLGSFIRVNSYRRPDYEKSGLDLRFSVVNHISAYWETSKQSRDMTKLSLTLTNKQRQSIKKFRFGGHTFECVRTEQKYDGKMVPLRVYSDMPLTKRIPFYRQISMPFAMLPMRVYGNSVFCKQMEQLPIIVKQREEFTLDPHDLMNKEFEVHFMISDLFSNFSWRTHEDAIVKKYLDTSLLHFLSMREIPIWAAISGNVDYRDIKDNELAHLNECMFLLYPFAKRFPNAINRVAVEYLMYCMEELVDKQVASYCSFCARIIRYKKGKKHCSMRIEGRDCGKSARNRRHYAKNRDTILPRMREGMRLHRNLLKQHTGKVTK